MRYAETTLSLIGNTPLLRLRNVTAGLGSSIFVKCEYLNPSGSIKDRMALKMIEGAEKSGKLKPGGTIVDMSSGNTGPALSFVGNVKGYRVRLHIPSKWTGSYNPENRIKLMRLFGADVTPIDLDSYRGQLQGLTGQEYAAAAFALGMKACYDLERQDSSFWWADQMSNPDNTLAHELGTGAEVIEQLDGKLSAFVASIGTGATLLGVAHALQSSSIGAKVVGVEPEDSKVIEEWARTGFLNDYLEKLGMPRRKYIIEQMVEEGVPEQMVHVGHEEAREMANRLCKEEGIFCGISSGANVHAALQVAKSLPRGSNIVTVCVDRRDRYLPEHPAENYVI